MSAWIIITATDLNQYQAAKLILAARTKALAASQPDPFLEVMPDVVNTMRDDIRGRAGNVVSLTPLSVPPGLRGVAILLTIEAMQARLPGVTITEDLRTLIDDAKVRMKAVRRGDVPVDKPDDPETTSEVQSGAPTVSVVGCPPRKRSTRESMSRL